MIVNLQIDRLVLDGLPLGTHQAPLLQAAVEAELARLLAAGAGKWDPQGGALRDSSPAAISIDRGTPESLGTRIGLALYERIAG